MTRQDSQPLQEPAGTPDAGGPGTSARSLTLAPYDQSTKPFWDGISAASSLESGRDARGPRLRSCPLQTSHHPAARGVAPAAFSITSPARNPAKPKPFRPKIKGEYVSCPHIFAVEQTFSYGKAPALIRLLKLVFIDAGKKHAARRSVKGLLRANDHRAPRNSFR